MHDFFFYFNQKLFTFESTVNIVNCSLSPDRCIVAYTTRTTKDKENGE